MTDKITQLEYAKAIVSKHGKSTRVPFQFMTMGDVVEMLERIEELKAELKSADEGLKLFHSIASNGEQSVLSRLDGKVDEVDAVNWQDAPEYKEAQQVSDNFNFDTVTEQEF